MKLQPLSPMIGLGYSTAVQPVYGSPIFSPTPPSAAFHRPSLLPPHILDYFPGLAGDGLRITFAHAVNSRSRLSAALMGKTEAASLVKDMCSLIRLSTRFLSVGHRFSPANPWYFLVPLFHAGDSGHSPLPLHLSPLFYCQYIC
jgi:hypothetical protein